MAEFKIKVGVELDDSGIKGKLESLGEGIELKLDTNKIESQLKSLKNSFKDAFKLDGSVINDLNKIAKALEKVNRADLSELGVSGSRKNTSNQLISQYKELYNLTTKLQKQLAKGGLGEDSIERTKSQIDKLKNSMDNLFLQMDDVQRYSITLFDEKQTNKAMVDMNSYLNKIESTATGLKEKMGNISFDHIDSSKLELINAKIEEIQTKAREGIDLDFSDVGDILNDLNKLSTVIKDLEKVENLASSFDKVSGTIKDMGGDVENFASTLKDLENTATTLDGSFDRAFNGANSELKEMKSSADNVARAIKTMDKNTGSMLGSWDDFKGNFAQFTLAEIAGDFLSDGIRSMGRGLVSTITDTDKAITELNKVYDKGLSGENLQEYLLDFTQVAKETGKTSVDVISGTASAIQSGIDDIDQALVFARQSAIFSNVGDIDQETANTTLNSIMSAYGGVENALKPVREQVQGMGKDYNTLTKFMDLANYAGNNFAVSTADVGEALRNSASALNNTGVTMEQSVGMAVAMNEILQDAGRSGNALKSISAGMTGLTASAKDGSIQLTKSGKAMKEIAGIDVWNEKTGEVKNMYEVMDELSLKWDDLSEAEQAALGTSIAGKTQLTAFSALLSNWETAKQLVDDYNKGLTIGSAEKENLSYIDSIAGKWNAIKENMKSIGTSLISSDAVKSVLDVLEQITSKIAEFASTDLGKNALGLGAIATALLTIASAFKSLTGVGSIIKTLSGLGTVAGSATSVATGLAGIGTAAGGATGGVSGLVAALGGVGSAAVGISVVVGALVGLASVVGDSTNSLSSLQRELGNIGTTIGTVCEVINGTLQMTFGTAFEYLGGLGKGIGALLKGDFSEIDDIIRETMASAKTNMEEGWSDFTGTTNNALKIMRNSTQEQMSGVSDVFNTTFKDLPKLTSSSLDEVTNTFVDKLSGMTQGELTVLEGMGGEIGAMLFDGIDAGMKPEQMSEKIKRNLEIALQAGILEEGEVSKLVDTFNGQLEKCLVDSGGNFKQAGTELFNQMKEGLQSGNWEDAFQDATQGMDNWTNEMLDKQRDFGDAWSTVMDGIHEGMNNEEIYEKMLSNFEEYSKGLEGGAEEAINNLRKEQQEAHKVIDETNELANSFESLPKEVKTDLVANFQGTDADLLRIHNMLEQFDEETQVKLKSEGFKEVLQEAESVSDFIENLPEDKLVELITTTNFEGSLTPEELQVAIDNLPQDKKIGIVTQMITSGELSIDQLEVALSNLPPETQANVITQVLQEGTYTVDQLEPMLTSLPTETLLSIITQLQGAEQVDKVNSILASLPEDVRVQIQALINGEQDLETTKQKIDEIDGKEATANVNVDADTSGAEEVIEVVESVPEEKEVKISIVQAGADLISGIGNFLSSLGKKNEQTVTIKAKVGDIDMGNINIKPIDIEAKVGKVDTSSISSTSVKPIDVEAKVNDVDTSAINSASVKPIDVKAKVGDVDTSAIDGINPPPVDISVKVTGQEQVNSLKSTLTSMQNKTITVTASGNALTQINSIKTALSGLQSKSISVATSVNGTTAVNALKVAISSLQGKSVNVSAGVSGTGEVNSLTSAIGRVQGKTVSVTANVTGTSQVNALISAINRVKSKSVKISASVSGTGSVQSLASAIASVQSKTVSVRVNKTVTTTEQTVKASPMSASMSNGISMASASSDVSASTDGASPVGNVSFGGLGVSAKAGITSAGVDLRNILSSIDFDVDIFKNLEEALNTLEAELGIIDQKMENAFGQEKLNLLRQQIPLLRQQQQIQEQIAQGERQQNKELLSWLNSQGFKFDNLGNITNYVEKLVSMEKNVESLKEKYDKLNDAEEKNETATKSAKKSYDDASEQLNKAKKYLEEYFNTNSDEIQKATESWYEYQNAIIEVEEEIRNMAQELKELNIDSGYKNIERDMAELQEKLDLNETILDRAEGQEAIDLLKERIELTGKLQKEVGEMLTYETQLKNDLINELNKYGLKFRDDGSIVGYSQAIANLKQNLSEVEFDRVFEMVEQYLEKVMETIPELRVEIEKLNNEIKGSEDEIQEIYDDQAEAIEEARKETEKLAREAKELAQDQFLERISYAVERINNQFDELDHKIDILDALNENSDGGKYIDYLGEKVGLLNQKINLVNSSYKELVNQSNKLQQELLGYGVNTTQDGSIMDISSLMGSEDYNYIKDLANEYENIRDQLKDLELQSADAKSEIEELTTEIEKTRRELKLLVYDNEMKVLTDSFDELSSQLDKINNQLEYTYGTEKVRSMSRAIEIMNDQLGIQEELINSAYSKLMVYQRDLAQYGFRFDEEGDFTNFKEVMQEYQDSSIFDDLSDMTEEYFDLQSEIVGLAGDYNDLNVAIKDAYSEQLDITKEVEQEITDFYEKEYEKRKEEIEAYHDQRIKLLQEEKEAYQEMRDEQDYEKSVDDQLNEIEVLRKQIETARKDTSASGQKRLAELTKELADAEKELADITQEKMDRDYENNVDNEIKKLEEQQEGFLKSLEEQFSEESVAKMVREALTSGFIELNGEIISVEDALIDSINKSSEAYSSMADVIKNELVANLNVALHTMQQLENINGVFGLQDYGNVLPSTSANLIQTPTYISSDSGTPISIGDTYLTISGNVSDDIITEIEELINQKNNEMLNKIASNL